MDLNLIPEVVPTEEGVDITSPLKSHDAHVRLERDPDGKVVVCVDVFDTSIENANEAHLESRCEPDNEAGAAALSDWLRDEWGFYVRIGRGRLTITHARR